MIEAGDLRLEGHLDALRLELVQQRWVVYASAVHERGDRPELALDPSHGSDDVVRVGDVSADIDVADPGGV